jgi:hypothetical protein
MSTCDVLQRPTGRHRAGRPVDLTVPNGRKTRVRLLTERAEILFVREVVRDGGIAPWRHRAANRLKAARDAHVEGKLARTETAALVVALVDRSVRDVAARLADEDPDPAWADLWLHLARHALPPFRAEPLFLLGWTAWRLGDRPLAAHAVAEARRQDPAHRPAALLAALLVAGADREGRAPAEHRRGA